MMAATQLKEPVSLMGAMQAFLLTFYLFFVFTRLPEIIGTYFGTSVRMALLLLGLLLFAAILSGGIQRALSSKPSFAMAALTGWILLTIPFSVWKGGSFRLLVDNWTGSVLAFIVTASLITNLPQCRRAMYSIGLAMALLASVGVHFFGMVAADGRFAFNLGTLGNANLLAQHLLYGLPFCMLAIAERGLFSMRGFAGAAGSVFIFITVIRTGSRGGIVALLVMWLVIFLGCSLANKLKFIVFSTLVILAVLVVAPPKALSRYALLFSSHAQDVQESEGDLASAVASADQRRQSLEQSLRLTFEHPLFGVGPGMYVVAEDATARAEGKIRGAWLETHNSVTQISCETGIPGVLFYALFLLYSIKPLFSIRRMTKDDPELKQITDMAFALALSIIVTVSASVFCNIGYQVYFPVLGGLSVAFVSVAEPWIRSHKVGTPNVHSAPGAAAVPYPARHQPVNRASRSIADRIPS